MHRRLVGGLVMVACVLTTAIHPGAGSLQGEPRLMLRVPPFADADFLGGSALVLPVDGYEQLEMFIEQALSDLQPSTVRVTLNGVPMTPFVAVNFMPRGVRAIVRLNVSMSPEYSLRKDVENVLVLEAQDKGRVQYRAQFAITVDPAASVPRLAGLRGPRAGASGVTPPPTHAPPQVTILSDWPASTRERNMVLEAEVSDTEGLRRIVLEVNGKDVEEVVLQNERPVRKKNGMVARGALPGEVRGDGRRVTLRIPVRLNDNRLNIVAVRAENLLGLSARADQTIQVGR
jgi:hypothetical protein